MNAPWLLIARRELGQHEIAGPRDNPRILEYFTATTCPAPHDEVPWCSAFANWCMAQAGISGTRSAAAKSWATWGVPAELEPGAVVVIQPRQAGTDAATGSSSGYHVAFFLAQDETHIHLLGGNQGDQVKESAFPLAGYEVVGCRKPA